MSIPPDVPVNVPARVPQPGPKKPARGAPRYLSAAASGWRFQYRLPRHLAPGDSTLSGSRATIRKSLGPLPIRIARQKAESLAALCRVAAAAALESKECVMENGDLLTRVVQACQAAIGTALKNPSEALGVANGLRSALDTLNLVAGESAKGEAGLRHVVDNAGALTQNALAAVLAHTEGRLDPNMIDVRAALASLDTNARVGPSPTAALKTAPLFSEVSADYIRTRREAGAARTELQTLELRRKTWIDVIGDRPVDQYRPSDLQTYVNRMQFWPANATKRLGDAADGWNANDLIEANRDLHEMPLKKKTMIDGYNANIKTMMRFGMADHDYRDPFAGVNIRWPQTYGKSAKRAGIDHEVLNRFFASGVASGCLDEAMLPLLAYLCSRRLGLLLYLRGEHIRRKYGVMIAQMDSTIMVEGVVVPVPIKTEDSLAYFVLHNFLGEIGFIDWMLDRGDSWVFAAAHEHPDPSKYESKLQNRRLRAAGAVGGSVETLHSLRGDGITILRRNNVDARAARLQAGHELTSVHDQYGFQALDAHECAQIAARPLDPRIDWDIFRGLDFDKLAAGRREPGRRGEV